jgi:lysophospholipase L1-like esterase
MDKNSDLIVLGFGMNDSGTTKPEKYKRNLQRVISAIRSNQPDVPILLVSSIVANQESPIQKNDLLTRYLDVLRQITDENNSVAAVDVTSTWRMMLENKTYYDLTGNGFNHPNDFGHRVLAESVLSAILGNSY